MRQDSENADTETQLLEILAGMRVTPTPEADFEERFLYDFHELVAREAVCRPARHRLLEHLSQALLNFGMPRLAFGASSLGVAALAIGFISFPGEEPAAPTTVGGLALHRFESSLNSLTPGLARDFDNCTSIRVAKKADPFDRESVLVNRGGSYMDAANAYTSSTAQEDALWSSVSETEMTPHFAY